jgi:hypothetical protein
MKPVNRGICAVDPKRTAQPRKMLRFGMSELSIPARRATGGKAEATVPIRSGPCRVLWLSHDWSGPRGECGRCGQVRG